MKPENLFYSFCWPLLYFSGDFSWAQGSLADEDRYQGAPTRGVQLNKIQSPSKPKAPRFDFKRIESLFTKTKLPKFDNFSCRSTQSGAARMVGSKEKEKQKEAEAGK